MAKTIKAEDVPVVDVPVETPIEAVPAVVEDTPAPEVVVEVPADVPAENVPVSVPDTSEEVPADVPVVSDILRQAPTAAIQLNGSLPLASALVING